MKPLRGTILCAAALAPLAFCGCSRQSVPPPRTIAVSGQGSVRPKPDLVILELGVVSRHASLDAAQSNVAKKTQAVMDALRPLGVKPDEIQTSDYGANRYQMKVSRRKWQTLYRVYSNLSVRTEQVARAGKIVDALVHQGVNSISGPTFGLKDQPAARREAMDLAFKNAQKDAERLAQAGGMRLAGIDKLTVGEDYWGNNGLMLYRSKAIEEPMPGGPAMPMATGQVRVSATVNVTFRVE